MEFTLPAPLGAQASLLAQTPVRKPPDSTKVEAAPDAGKARAHMHNSTRHGAEDNVALPNRLDAEDEIRPDTLAGPPPTFLINVLEMEQKLQQQLARIEADRAADRSLANEPASVELSDDADRLGAFPAATNETTQDDAKPPSANTD